MFTLQNLSYIHPDKELLFDSLSLSVDSKAKIALIANNGMGKSTLLKIIAGQIPPSTGTITVSSKPFYVPQIVGQFDDLSVAQAIGIDSKLNALSAILSGNVSEANLSALNDDWMLEERCSEAFSHWGLSGLALHAKMKTLSGGQKTKVFLAGIKIHNPEIVLLDEPTNHLDGTGRDLLCRFIKETSCTMVVVSHDRMLLNQLEKMCELNRHGIKIYGGNYDFYREQKTLESTALVNSLEDKQKSLRKAKETEREALERQQKREVQGRKNTAKGGLPPILAGARKNNAENSTARLKGVHTDKINIISQELSDLRKEIPDRDKIKFGFDNSSLHQGKILIEAKSVNFAYDEKTVWKNPLSFQILSGERVAIKGGNGSGKTTLLQLILGNIEPTCGVIFRADNKTLYIDQEYSLLNAELSVYEQAQAFNDSALQEYEIKIRLNRFLFSSTFWDKPCAVLSGGERMRLLLCCLTITAQSPDVIVLDEPTNNIDIQNMELFATAVGGYRGTLIAVSHDPYFLKQVNIEREIVLEM
ncbi:MAG: ATP-binding cassette domain-containing protein [Dysgonamonadaceae bacterium]|jgi:ATPase subunit of ABC transporter with duplicated ATPase domains|nr:ATP-binding cassette domain-containing protein [Dysgonamonadaceae bacterium]